MRKPETIITSGARVRVLPKRSEPSMPENTTQALAWCRDHEATVIFCRDYVEIRVSRKNGTDYGLGDTFVTAVCDCIREATVRPEDIHAVRPTSGACKCGHHGLHHDLVGRLMTGGPAKCEHEGCQCPDYDGGQVIEIVDKAGQVVT